MSAVSGRASFLALLGFGLVGCAPLARFENTERLAAKTATELSVVEQEGKARHAQFQEELLRLKNRLEGASAATIRVPAGGVLTAVFGNHSGHNTAATITHRAEDFKGPGTSIRIVRVNYPRNAQAMPAPPGASAPDFAGTESTVWLDLSSAGSRRQLVVPCGYQVEATSRNGAVLDVLLKYQSKECQ